MIKPSNTPSQSTVSFPPPFVFATLPAPLISGPLRHPQALDPEDNFARASTFITSAAKRGAHLAVLPEYHLTNWLPQSPPFPSLCAQWKYYLHRYQALAKEHRICIVPGTIVELHNDEATGEEKLLNVAYFIDNKGDVLGRYQKKNLWHPEREHLQSSTHAPHDAFDTPIGKVGLLICWDLAFPEAFRELIAAGAKIIIIPAFWTLRDCTEYGLRLNPKAEALFLESAVTARAYENTCCVVFVNAGASAGRTDEGAYAGLSTVALPFVGAMGEETMRTAEEGMSIVDVDMEVVEEAEKNYGVREDLARDGWHYTYRHQEKGKI
ncbi:MAG: hypothetical protein Q9163_004002 [Psora crenata]